MTFKKVKGNFDRLFDKNLTDLVRGIRNNREHEAKYIAQCMEEIKEELRQDNLGVKANAVSKLTYLQMLGYDISWAAFNVIEVMSSTKFTHKRIGYLCASQSFQDTTDVMMLTTNMIRKDLTSQNMYDAGCAMSGLACFVSADLSRDLANDIMILLSSTKPYLRKKAVLLMYKVFLKYPDALKPAFPRLKEKLEDPDPGVQSAAVNVICELARKNPRNYLPLAPVFFKLMTNSTNNWMLIKIIKLFGSLTPLEPRLGKKLIEPLTNLIHSTSAMSLLYECINTVIAVLISISSGLPNHNASIQLCVQKLRILIEDSDQNLKYLGLLAMSKILKTHPKSVQAHKDLVLSCLEDKDESIRLRALDLLYGMVSKKNLMEIVRKLMMNVAENPLGNKYRDELIAKIIDICSQNDYQLVPNFEWYISVLVDLSRVQGGTEHGRLIAQQMMDVAIRVESIRPFAAEQMAILLDNCILFANNTSVCEVLVAAAWICGEFSIHLPNKNVVLFALLPPRLRFPSHIESVFLLNSAKIFAEIASELSADDIRVITDRLSVYVSSEDLEVQERGSNFLNLIQQPSLFHTNLFKSYPLNPVAVKAQKKVPVPQGLDLDIPFVVLEEDMPVTDTGLGFSSDNEDGEKKRKKIKRKKEKKEGKKKEKKHKERSKQEDTPIIEIAEEVAVVPIKSKKSKKQKAAKVSPERKDPKWVLPTIPGLASSDQFVAQAKKGKKKAADDSEDDAKLDWPVVQHTVTIKELEMPEGAEDDGVNSEDDMSRDPLAKVVLDPITFEKPSTPESTVKKSKKKAKKVEKEGKRQNGNSDAAVDVKETKKKRKKKVTQAPAREEYEETLESTEPTPHSSPPHPEFQPLADNEDLTVLFSNLSLNPTNNVLHCSLKVSPKQMESLPKLAVSWSDSETRTFECETCRESETEFIRLQIQGPSIAADPGQVSGAIKYSLSDGEESKEVSFVIPIPLSTFVTEPETDQPVSQVVAELTCLSSIIIDFEGGLNKFLQKLTGHIALKVTDQLEEEEAATLQGVLGSEDLFCFLVKSEPGGTSISLHGKGKIQSNLDRIMSEVKQLFLPVDQQQ